MTAREAGRIARRYGVQLFDAAAAPHAARWCNALVVDGVALVVHRRTDTPAELRARCRWASKRVRAG